MDALLTAIQRFSLSDGDGIRTTVFFKGCNMNCDWCHNPETINCRNELMFYESKCIGCGRCFVVCPMNLHKIIDGKHTINRNLCEACGKCTEYCYAEALKLCGKIYSVEDVMSEIMQDIEYYNESGGGVTLSGGEVYCQKDFAISLCEACRKENISVGIETNLFYDFEKASELLKKCDLIMCDLKLFDSAKHKEHTGVDNHLIKENIKKADDLGIPLIIRTPLIPGVTDNAENIFAITEFIKDLKNLRRYELLKFNPLGENKYTGLDRENKYKNCRVNSEENLKEITEILTGAGIPYKII